MLKTLKAVALCGVLALTSFGADLYVSRETGSNKAAGTKEAPLKNLWKAVDMAEDGDVIHVAAGNYNGQMNKGWIEVTKAISIIGGYSSDFSERNPVVHQTMMRPSNKMSATKPPMDKGLLAIIPKRPGPENKILIDGLIFDHTDSNSYHGTKGKPEGFKEGMLTIAPAKGTKPLITIDSYMIKAITEGELTIQNCLFLNSSNIALNVQHGMGKVRILNNVFVGCRIISADVRCGSAKPLALDYEFAYNTVLFTWTRTSDFQDMGYGVRSNSNTISNIHHNVLGLNCMAGWDNSKGADKTKKVSVDNNIFFLNKKGDVTRTVSPSVQFLRVDEDGFEDIADAEGMESVEDNVSLTDPAVFKGILDMEFVNAFLAATYTEETDYDENSPMNNFRAALGLNKQGTITSKVTMWANPYPFDSAIKLFGAIKDYGAQAIK